MKRISIAEWCGLALLAINFAILVICCKANGSPVQPAITVEQVTGELVDAGCLAPGPNVSAAVAAEHATSHDPWLECLFDGGSVSGCGAPCKRESDR